MLEMSSLVSGEQITELSRCIYTVCRSTHVRPTVLTLQLVIEADMLVFRITASSQNFKPTNSLIFKA